MFASRSKHVHTTMRICIQPCLQMGHTCTGIKLVCRRNLEDMLRIPWHVAVFDEAHKLKNRNAKIYDACCALQTKLRYGLTGTAMQVCTATALLQADPP